MSRDSANDHEACLSVFVLPGILNFSITWWTDQMRKLMTYFLVFASVALVGCSEKQTTETAQPVLKVAVAADGMITLDGRVISLEELRDEFAAAVGTEPVVWLYRAQSEGDPPEESRLVFRAIVEHLFPISFSSEPDFSTVVDHDGNVKPRP